MQKVGWVKRSADPPSSFAKIGGSALRLTHPTLAPRAGFSLVELLVVIAVIGLLISLLLPAVQAARESARRLGCSNNFHQIGIGLQSYHDSFKRFPEGGVEMRTLVSSSGSLLYPNGRQLAWSAYILPYLEMKSLSGRIDFKKAFDSPENAQAAAEIIPAYLCPSVSRRSYLVQGRGACDYGGIYGERIVSGNNPPRGVMLYGQSVRIRDIADGTAHTLMISEDCLCKNMQWINGMNVFDVAYALNAAPAFENDPRSKHPGGVNGLMADGSARFIRNEIDLKTLAALCTRNGGEPPGEF
jgi:prepilin-type N-terminal cleavage/methylation domain-containing protein/prepilin-type processing-associated H-X9-DG protein